MTALAPVFAALVPVFVLIALGVAVRHLLLEREEHWVAIERIVYFILFPALFISALARTDLSAVPFVHVGGVLAGTVIAMSLLCLALRPRLMRMHQVDGPAFTSIFQGATRWQTFVALPVAGTLYGQRGLALASVAVISMIPLLNVINVWVLAHFASPDGTSMRKVLTALARNPLIFGCVVGLLLSVSGLRLPDPVHLTIAGLGQASLPLGLLMVGAGLSGSSLHRPGAPALTSAVLKLGVMPALAITLARLLGLSGSDTAVVACCAAVPTASSAYVLARQMGGDAPLMARILTVETLLAMVTMPLAIAFASSL